jgi:hypothetical protein
MFERRKIGVEVAINVGRMEWRIVAGAMDEGTIHDLSERNVGIIERGGCVLGVRMIFVRAISIGASTRPAMPEAATAATMERNGDEEAEMSIAERVEGPGNVVVPDPASGRPSRAQMSERRKDVMVL